MKATTCQMSNVCCAMCNVVVKARNDLPTRRPNPQWENDFVIWSLGQWVLGQVHWTSHNRHSTFDSFGLSSFFSQLHKSAPTDFFSMNADYSACRPACGSASCFLQPRCPQLHGTSNVGPASSQITLQYLSPSGAGQLQVGRRHLLT